MEAHLRKTPAEWLTDAETFYARDNWIGALSAARNALRHDVKLIRAWRLASDTAWKQKRHYHAGRYARGLKRFAEKAGEAEQVQYAKHRLAEVAEYFATVHRIFGETDLTHAAGRGDLARVTELLKAGADINEPNSSGWTPLHTAAARGAPETIRLLVEHGANIEAENTLRETPLITACSLGNPRVVPVLLELGANVRHVAKEKHTALWYAISSQKNVDLVRLLLEAGANPNESYEYRDNPLLIAVCAQAPAVVNLLLPLTKDPARINKHGVCALHFATSYNDADLVRALLARGVDVNLINSYGHTALMSAAENNSLNAARVLLEHNADRDAKSQYGDTALSLAEHRDHEELAALLRAENSA